MRSKRHGAQRCHGVLFYTEKVGEFVLTQQTTKGANKRRLRMLVSWTRGHRLAYLGALLSVLLSAAIGFVTPQVMRTILDSILGDQPFSSPFMAACVDFLGGRALLLENLWICGLALILINLVNAVFLFTRGAWTNTATEAILRALRNRLYDHLQRVPYDYHVKTETGDLIQRCTSDVETVRRFLAGQLVELARGIFMLALALGIMLSMNVPMTLIAVCAVPFMILTSLFFFKRMQHEFEVADRIEGAMSTVLQESLTGVRVVRAFGRQAYEIDKFGEKNTAYRDKWFKLNTTMSAFWAMSDGFGFFQSMVVILVGVYNCVHGTLTLGTLTAFASYSSMLIWPMRQMGRILADMGKALISTGRIQQILDAPLEEQPGDRHEKPDIRARIVFDHVSFAYGEGDPVLEDLCLTVEPGQTVAILGATGSGKSSLVHLLQRLYDYTAGSITIGGVALKDIDRRYLRERVGIVLQEPFLYSRTIGENIGISMDEREQTQVEDAARIASAHEFIQSFEKGYDTVVGERGVTLSGGQKQRVAIARTLTRDSDILIFDDSLSAVDTQTDAAIRQALRQRRAGITTFIISHRLSTLSEADKIVVLEGGRVAQEGTHEQLIAQDGLYRRVWAIQNSLEAELESEVNA